LETGAVVAVTVQDADEGDPTTSRETLIEAAEQMEAVQAAGDGLQEVVGDKGYHSSQSLVDLAAVGVRSYFSEPIGDVATRRRSPKRSSPPPFCGWMPWKVPSAPTFERARECSAAMHPSALKQRTRV
jgi:hypothetical protein